MEQISFEWEFHSLGSVRLNDDKLRFPVAANRPGIYRFTILDDNGSRQYIGEAELLARRFQHYRTPGPTQTTNIRLNDEMRQVLANGGQVAVDIVSESWIVTSSGERTPIDLYWKPARVMIEAAVLVAARQGGQHLLNL